MPLYDYRCAECGNEIEVMHPIDGTGPAECDVCGGPMRKALSPPAIHFKGSGWAKKDARSAAKKSGGSSAAGDKAAGDKAAGAKTAEGKTDKDGKGEGASSAGGAKPDTTTAAATPTSTSGSNQG